MLAKSYYLSGLQSAMSIRDGKHDFFLVFLIQVNHGVCSWLFQEHI